MRGYQGGVSLPPNVSQCRLDVRYGGIRGHHVVKCWKFVIEMIFCFEPNLLCKFYGVLAFQGSILCKSS